MIGSVRAACLSYDVAYRKYARAQDAAYGAELQFSDLAATQASYLSQRSEAPAREQLLLPLGGGFGGPNG